MSGRTVFSSNNSFSDASMKASLAGYFVVGRARNPKTGQYIVFGKKKAFF